MSHKMNLFKHGKLWSPQAPLVGEIDICAPRLFCMKFNSEQFLFEASFDVMGIFGSMRPKGNLISHFYTLYDFKYTDLWSPLAPLVEEIDISAPGIFCPKFNPEQLLFEVFFDIMHILGSIEP